MMCPAPENVDRRGTRTGSPRPRGARRSCLPNAVGDFEGPVVVIRPRAKCEPGSRVAAVVPAGEGHPVAGVRQHLGRVAEPQHPGDAVVDGAAQRLSRGARSSKTCSSTVCFRGLHPPPPVVADRDPERGARRTGTLRRGTRRSRRRPEAPGRDRPAPAVSAIDVALRVVHQVLPPPGCPCARPEASISSGVSIACAARTTVAPRDLGLGASRPRPRSSCRSRTRRSGPRRR